MSLCVYRRIRQEPIRLKLNGKLVLVKGGETVVADTREMMGISGFAFIKLYEQKDNFVPAKTNLTISRPPPIIDINNDENQSIQVEEIIINNNLVSVDTQEKPVEKKEVKKEEQPVTKTQIGFKKDTIEYLKGLDNKQWFSLKKEDIVKFLDDANIEYKHISGDKWELLKFLKKIIKEL